MTKTDAEMARDSLAGSGFLILTGISHDNTNTCLTFNQTTLYPNMTDAEAFAAMRQVNRSYKLDLFTWQRGIAVFVMVNTLLEASEMLAAASAQSCRDFQRNADATLSNFEEIGVPPGPLSWFRDAFAHLAANFESIAFNLQNHATTAVNSYARRNDTRPAWDERHEKRPDVRPLSLDELTDAREILKNARQERDKPPTPPGRPWLSFSDSHNYDPNGRCRKCGIDRTFAINTGTQCRYPSGDASGDAAPTPTDTDRPAAKNEIDPNA